MAFVTVLPKVVRSRLVPSASGSIALLPGAVIAFTGRGLLDAVDFTDATLAIEVRCEQSEDGLTWDPARPLIGCVWHGGIGVTAGPRIRYVGSRPAFIRGWLWPSRDVSLGF